MKELEAVDEERWAELPGLMYKTAREEWQNRTWWGKLLYPGWLAMVSLMWITLLLFLVTFGFPVLANRFLDWLAEAWNRNTPATHKD